MQMCSTGYNATEWNNNSPCRTCKTAISPPGTYWCEICEELDTCDRCGKVSTIEPGEDGYYCAKCLEIVANQPKTCDFCGEVATEFLENQGRCNDCYKHTDEYWDEHCHKCGEHCKTLKPLVIYFQGEKEETESNYCDNCLK